MGGPPPLCVVPGQTFKAKNKSSVTLKIIGRMKQDITKFAGGSCEEALHHVQIFWSLDHRFQYHLKIANAKKAKKAQEEALDLIQDNNSNAS